VPVFEAVSIIANTHSHRFGSGTGLLSTSSFSGAKKPTLSQSTNAARCSWACTKGSSLVRRSSKLGSTFYPSVGDFVLEALWEYRIVLRGGMELAEAVLRVGADVIEEIVRVLAGGVRTRPAAWSP